MKDFSYITNSHPAYIEELYQGFLKDPGSVDPEFRKFFEGFDFAQAVKPVAVNGSVQPAPATDQPAAPQVDWRKDWVHTALFLAIGTVVT